MNVKEALKNKYSILVFIDIVMMILLVINLSMILFDWLFVIPYMNKFLLEHAPVFYTFYHDNIHINFTVIDPVFVTLFLAEFMFSWALAIIKKVYHRWFFYPFLHWYDLIGCIPVGSFRFVRILRVFSILVRLQNLKIIDLTNTYFYGKFRKYYGIVVEEISDRVVVNILEGVQDEIMSGGPVMETIIRDVIRPRQDTLVEWISRRLGHALEREVLVRKEEIEEYIKNLISDSLRKNEELKTVQQLPIMGKMIARTIENSISQSINDVIEKALNDMASNKNRKLINDVTDAILNTIEYRDEEPELNEVFRNISHEIIEVIKKQVQIQKWKLKGETEQGMGVGEQKSVEFLMADK